MNERAPGPPRPAGASAAAGEERLVAMRAGLVGVATLFSRVLGLVREQVMAGLFGAGFATDAFNVAFRIPNLLRDLFAEGAMSSAFVPTFTRVREHEGPEAAWALGRQLLVTLGLTLALICAAGWALAPWLVPLFAPGFGAEPGKLELTILLTRVMLPFLPLVALAAACMGMLNAGGRFFVPALAPALLNLGMIVVGVALIPACQRAGLPPILAMAIGVVVGGLGQLLVQLPSLHGLGFRLRLEWPTFPPGVRRVATLMLPATVGLAATQINLFVSTVVASMLEQGSVSWLWYAFRLMQLPIGVFGVAIATVSLPALSRSAAVRDMDALRGTLSVSLRLLVLLTLPAAVWLAVSSRPVIALLYEHGRFGPPDTERTASALVMYCVGLPAFAAVGVLTRAFYALGDTRTPVRASFVAVAVNLALNLLLMRPLGHLGLALATSVTSIVNLAQLAYFLRGPVGGLDGARLAGTSGRIALACVVVMAPLAVALAASGDRWHVGVLGEGLAVVVLAAVAALGLWAAMRALRVTEIATVEDLVRSVFGRLAGRKRA